MNKLYTVGYSGVRPLDLKRAVENLGADLVDIRHRAGSRNPAWNKTRMQKFFGPAYWHCRELGNVNYRNGGPIKLANPEKAAGRIIEILEDKPVVILCACRAVYTCHRHEAAMYFKRELGVEFEHLLNSDILELAGLANQGLLL